MPNSRELPFIKYILPIICIVHFPHTHPSLILTTTLPGDGIITVQCPSTPGLFLVHVPFVLPVYMYSVNEYVLL